jgi:hypothetical protein
VSWINKNKKVLRVIVLLLLGAAILGPWIFDIVSVPSKYACQAPYIRVNERFCGVPLSGIRFLAWMVPGFIYAGRALVTRAIPISDWGRGFIFSLLLFLILLPFFSNVLLILRGERRRLQVFNVLALSLALGVCLLFGLTNSPKLSWALWGLWLYIAVAAAALLLEILGLAAGRSTPV